MAESCGNPAAEAGEALMPRKRRFDRSRTCVKCKAQQGNLVIRHSVYCRDCFTPLVTTKFRQALEPHLNHTSAGPRRGALKPSGNLLVAFSGGLGSTVLLDLVHQVYCSKVGSIELKGGKEHPRKNRIWRKIYVCYVETSDVLPEASDRTQRIREAVEEYGEFEFVPVRVQDAFDRSWWERVSGGSVPNPSELSVDLSNEELFRLSDTEAHPDPLSALQAYLHKLPTPTAVQSTISILTRVLLLYTAYSIGASHLVFGTSLTSLSISLISSISQGGGFVVPQSIQEEWVPSSVETSQKSTSWRGEVRLIRPLREVGMKECTAWAWWHRLVVVGKQKVPAARQTIGDLTKDFIIGLERDYPSTVSTIAKTVGKLAPKGDAGGRCIICELPTQRSVQQWKARISVRSFNEEDPSATTTAAPSLTPWLCYSCHTTLTSKSSRSNTSSNPGSSAAASAVMFPTWAAMHFAIGSSNPQATDPHISTADEVWGTRKLDSNGMKSLVEEFLVDD
ncbi:hypothetical protein BC834DRAFT_883479 [Gloeopeniophorella convolvens]|nr:hypothetical protein BC834DRAFT_883479 [Gloeopeniophorella convolvens]